MIPFRPSFFLPVLLFCLTITVCSRARADSYTDSQNLVTLQVRPTASSAPGYVAWQFEVVPVGSAHEVSSIDAATGDFGFTGPELRQVNPNGLATVFADFNPFFPSGEDGTSDTQFVFNRSALAVVPNSDVESATSLQAAFTGFEPIGAESTTGRFAQIVMPTTAAGSFSGVFAVRPISGGVPLIAEIGPISFSITPGDFNLDGEVDGNDYLLWQRTDGAGVTLSIWQSSYGDAASVAVNIPEPGTIRLLLLIAMFGLRSRQLCCVRT